MKYRNIHTSEVKTLTGRDVVNDGGQTATLYVLSDGTRWNEPDFLAHWRSRVELLGYEMSEDAYAALVSALSGLLIFLVGCGFAVTYGYTGIPYLLFFAGWFMRSAWAKAHISFKWRD